MNGVRSRPFDYALNLRVGLAEPHATFSCLQSVEAGVDMDPELAIQDNLIRLRDEGGPGGRTRSRTGHRGRALRGILPRT
jgi:hypothetical protein